MANPLIYTATLSYKRPPSSQADNLVLTGQSDGASDPKYILEDSIKGLEQIITSSLAEAYAAGLYGTGSVGQVRDMLNAMSALSSKFLWVLEIPEETKAKANEEATADAAALPDGAVY